MISTVVISTAATKQIKKAPAHVVRKLQVWIRAVIASGLREVRKAPGFHDEPLKGQRQGQRSIRLSRLYRAIYTVSQDGQVELVRIEEVTPHAY